VDRFPTAGAGWLAPPRPALSGPATVKSARPQILVAAAAVEQRDALVALLGRAGCDPRPVADGQAALRRLLVDPPALAVLAADLPGLSGLQVLEELRRRSELPVILVGPDCPETKRQAVWLGADRYLVRPPDAQQLLRALASVLPGRSA
jgi:two-component system response regulator BaeR